MAGKIWALCNVLRGDGISYNQYISELTYLLFLKVAHENGSEATLPQGYRWRDLVQYSGPNLLGHYQELLTHLGACSENPVVRDIYAFPTTVFSHSENLRVVLDGLDELDWQLVKQDSLGQIYEGLLSRNSEDARSGAGQYFTPRALVDCMVAATKPALGETIQDPASGTGGFLISADHFVREGCTPDEYARSKPRYEGMEIERGTYRLCLMNVFLHRMEASIWLGDALTEDGERFSDPDVILANPPFGSKSGSVRANRGNFAYSSSNKQLEFLQHIYHGLKPGGRAAVVMPDNALFEEGVGRQIRQELMRLCSLHTILRLPTGIFYAQGVKTSVLFFTKGPDADERRDHTRQVWIYDLRSGAPRFGKRTSLTRTFFDEFVQAFGSWPELGRNMRERVQTERFKAFSREELAENGDNLDIRWLAAEEAADEFEGLRPDEIAALIVSTMKDTLRDMEELYLSFGGGEAP